MSLVRMCTGTLSVPLDVPILARRVYYYLSRGEWIYVLQYIIWYHVWYLSTGTAVPGALSLTKFILSSTFFVGKLRNFKIQACTKFSIAK
jgi:hypothetical protein